MEIKFTETDRQALDYERYHHPHPKVQRKMEVLWLKSQGKAPQEISQLASVSVSTVYRYLSEYRTSGVAGLKVIRLNRPQSKLVAHTGTIRAEFESRPPASMKEAAHRIEKLTGIKRSRPQVSQFLKTIGLKRRKVGMIPAKANPEVQAKFKKEELEPVLEEAKAGKKKVYFVDAAHFVLAPFLGYLWSFVRIFIQAPSGRQRFNVLGALDAISHELVMVTNEEYINAHSVCLLLDKLRKANPDIPIVLILDNARYQKCKLVWNKALDLEIDLLYLPPYSPNLNLIERLWKFVKKECLYSIYYADFDAFKSAISHCLAHTHDTHKDELDSLLTLNFQTFEPSLCSHL